MRKVVLDYSSTCDATLTTFPLPPHQSPYIFTRASLPYLTFISPARHYMHPITIRGVSRYNQHNTAPEPPEPPPAPLTTLAANGLAALPPPPPPYLPASCSALYTWPQPCVHAEAPRDHHLPVAAHHHHDHSSQDRGEGSREENGEVGGSGDGSSGCNGRAACALFGVTPADHVRLEYKEVGILREPVGRRKAIDVHRWGLPQVRERRTGKKTEGRETNILVPL